MEAKTSWSLLGQRPLKPRPNVVALVIAFLLGFETFVAVTDVYPTYMSVLAIGASSWALFLGVRSKAIFSLAFLPVSMIWLNPLLGGDWLNELGATLFLSHSALAMLFAVAGYTYLATEKVDK